MGGGGRHRQAGEVQFGVCKGRQVSKSPPTNNNQPPCPKPHPPNNVVGKFTPVLHGRAQQEALLHRKCLIGRMPHAVRVWRAPELGKF